MKEYVIDANVLFSAIISQKPIYIDLVNNFDIYAPDFILREINKYKDFLLTKINIEDKKCRGFIRDLFDEIIIIPSFAIPISCKEKAMEICKDIDEKDTPYLALSINYDIPLISSDKGLVGKTKEKGYAKIILMSEFYKELYQMVKDKKRGNKEEK